MRFVTGHRDSEAKEKIKEDRVKMGVHYTRNILQLLMGVCVICSATAASPQPLWKSLLVHHRAWLGFYRHDGGNYNCHLKVNSVGTDGTSTTYITFTAEHVSLDMSVWSQDDQTVIFQESSTWHQIAHFEGHTNLRFRGEMLPYNSYYRFVGNVSSDEVTDFGTITLRPYGAIRAKKKENDDLKYGLSIGVPVAMAVCLTVSGALILWWAFKKGYLRHIPRAYKNFTNPRSTTQNMDTSTTNAERTSDHEMTGQEPYHIEQPGSVHI